VEEYDKKNESDESWRNVLKTEMIFVAVPTPTIDGEQNISALHEVLSKLARDAYKGVICIKCTILPGTTLRLAERFNLRLVHNPEFLTAAKPFEDFMTQKAILLGGHLKDCAVVGDFYHRLLPSTPVLSYGDPTITEVAKYYHNCFLAVKVTLANEFFDICQFLGIHYWEVREATLTQGGVGSGHSKVPGPDGKTGYGLGCFPKDMLALIAFCKSTGILTEVLPAAHEGNSRRRKFDESCQEVSDNS
jgi:nucleotide sugar dehydrogenase